jgi:hypothetical protein
MAGAAYTASTNAINGSAVLTASQPFTALTDAVANALNLAAAAAAPSQGAVASVPNIAASAAAAYTNPGALSGSAAITAAAAAASVAASSAGPVPNVASLAAAIGLSAATGQGSVAGIPNIAAIATSVAGVSVNPAAANGNVALVAAVGLPAASNPGTASVMSSLAAAAASAAAAAYTNPTAASAKTAILAGIAAETGALDVAALLGQLAQSALPFLGLGAAAGALWLGGTGPAGGESEREFELLVNAAIAADGEDGPQIEGAPAEKATPNPGGKLGGPEHRAGVAEVKEELSAKYPDRALVDVTGEEVVDTPDGEKQRRYLDAAAVDAISGQIIEGIQVGKETKSGNPVSREQRALNDIRAALPDAIIGFRAYNGSN